MAEEDGVRKLVDIIFGKTANAQEDVVAGNSSIPACLLSEEFSKRMLDVLFLRKYILYSLWGQIFDKRSQNMFCSHKDYLANVIGLCLYEYNSNRNIFECFISLCAIVEILSNEALEKAGVNFLDLNPDIIMVLYQNVLKESFDEHGGLHQFVQYVHGHRSLKWNWKRDDFISRRDPFTPLLTKPDLYNNLLNEYQALFEKVPESPKGIESLGKFTMLLSEKVHATTSAELPALPSRYDLIARLVSSRKREIAERNRRAEAAPTSESLNEILQRQSSSSSESETDNTEIENTERHENIIRADTRCNHSQNSCDRKMENDKIFVETEGLQEHLKGAIKPTSKILETAPTSEILNEAVQRQSRSNSELATPLAEILETTPTSESWNEAVQRKSSSSSESETNNTTNENTEPDESMIEAVKRCNLSQNSGGQKKENDKILVGTEGLQEHLKGAI